MLHGEIGHWAVTPAWQALGQAPVGIPFVCWGQSRESSDKYVGRPGAAQVADLGWECGSETPES